MRMNEVQQRLLRALISAQVAVLEWGEASVNDQQATAGLDLALKECMKLAKKLREQ